MVGRSIGLAPIFVLSFFFFFLGISETMLYVSVNLSSWWRVDHLPWVSSTCGATISSVSFFFFFFLFSLTSTLCPSSRVVAGSHSVCCAP